MTTVRPAPGRFEGFWRWLAHARAGERRATEVGVLVLVAIVVWTLAPVASTRSGPVAFGRPTVPLTTTEPAGGLPSVVPPEVTAEGPAGPSIFAALPSVDPTEPPVSTPVEPTPPARDDAPAPGLVVIESGYDSAFAASGDPDLGGQGLPVAVHAGVTTRRAFVRLAGTGTTLDLRVLEGSVTQLAEGARILACPVTQLRAFTRGMDQSDSPPFDCTNAAAGELRDGALAIDLSTAANPINDRGFALVGATQSLATFQVVFAVDS